MPNAAPTRSGVHPPPSSRRAYRLWFVTSVLALLGTVSCGALLDEHGTIAGSGASDGGDTDPFRLEDGGLACVDGLVLCNDRCVDVSSNPNRCGACDNVCDGGEACFEGTCDGAAVTAVGAGQDLNCAVRKSGSVWCWGLTRAASLGRFIDADAGALCESGSCQPTPTKIEGLPPVESVSLRRSAACAVTKGGELYCWGENTYGALGVPPEASVRCGTSVCLDHPTKVDVPPNIAEVSLGAFSACARTHSGQVYCWGENQWGQLGHIRSSAFGAPERVPLDTAAKQLSVGANDSAHVCIVTASDTVQCWGSNQSSQLGRPYDEEAECFVAGRRCNPVAREIPDNGAPRTGIRQVLAGDGHTCVISMAGELACWGFNGYGVGSGTSEARTIAVPGATALRGRGQHVCVLASDASVSCFGLSLAGRLGVQEPPGAGDCAFGLTCRPAPQPALPFDAVQLDATEGTVALDRDGRVRAWGPNPGGALGVISAAVEVCPHPIPGSKAIPCSAKPLEVVMPTPPFVRP